MRIKLLFVALFLALSLSTIGLSGCSIGGHIGTAEGGVSVE